MLHVNLKNVLKEVNIWSTKQTHMGLDSEYLIPPLGPFSSVERGNEKRHSVSFRTGGAQDFGI